MSDDRSRLLATSEQVTLWTLGATVSLYVVGEISWGYRLDALGVRSLHTDAQWQQRVFEGGLAVLNSILNVANGEFLAWRGCAVAFALLLWLRRRFAARPRVRRLATGFAIAAYGAMLLTLAIAWGRFQARYLREYAGGSDHLVFAKDAQLPPELVQLNEQRKLKLVTTTPEFVVVFGPAEGRAYRIAMRDVETIESAR